MTRKTREEKKLAEYRRRLKYSQQTSVKTAFTQESVQTSDPTLIDTKTKTINLSVDNIDQTYFRKDLIKSMAFIFLIITLEIIIYFATMNRY